MPVEDAERWDRRYLQDERFRTYVQPRSFLVEQAEWLPSRGLALDVAMGLGGNAEFLLSRGLKVLGLDISSVALRRAKKRLPDLMAVRADLPEFDLPANSVDLILNFYYLERDLWVQYRQWLRPGGVVVFESLTQDMLNIQSGIDPRYLLQPNELLYGFKDFEILVYREGARISRGGMPSTVASLVARLPDKPV